MTTNDDALALGRTRTNLLRLAYVPLVLGLGIFQMPLLFELGPKWEIMHGVVICMLSALCLLSVVGLFRPVSMLPLLLFEIAWKAIWAVAVALPAWRNEAMTEALTENLFAVTLVIPIIALVPWGFVGRKIVRQDA